ncbi:MAG: hypothetical protein QM757_16320 [Paludibaculum sp.]
MTRADRGLERWDPSTNLVTIGGIADNPEDVGVGFSKRLFAPRVGFAYRLGQRERYSQRIRDHFRSSACFPAPARALPCHHCCYLSGRQQFQLCEPVRPPGIPAIATPDLSTGSILLPGTVENRSPYAGTLKRGYIQSWNFILERELPGSFIGTLGYVGTQTTSQFADKEINAAGLGGGNNGRPLARALRAHRQYLDVEWLPGCQLPLHAGQLE